MKKVLSALAIYAAVCAIGGAVTAFAYKRTYEFLY